MTSVFWTCRTIGESFVNLLFIYWAQYCVRNPGASWRISFSCAGSTDHPDLLTVLQNKEAWKMEREETVAKDAGIWRNWGRNRKGSSECWSGTGNQFCHECFATCMTVYHVHSRIVCVEMGATLWGLSMEPGSLKQSQTFIPIEPSI